MEQQHVENPPKEIENKPIEVDSNEKAKKKTCGTSTANDGKHDKNGFGDD